MLDTEAITRNQMDMVLSSEELEDLWGRRLVNLSY